MPNVIAEEKLLLISASNNIFLKKDAESNTEVWINGALHKLPEDQQLDDKGKEELAQKLKRDFYSNFLKTHFENLVILTGAGSSVGFGGFTMKELWDKVSVKLTPSVLEAFCKAVKFFDEDIDFDNLSNKDKNLEALLSKANVAKNFIESEFDIAGTIKICQEVISENCKIPLSSEAPHEAFLNKITNRKLKDPRVKVFTLNYDTLFEQAAIKGNFTVIDGFSFSFPRTLSGRNFDYDIVYREKSRIKEEDSFVPKVFHLYKPHGSLNWEFDKGSERIIINEDTKNPLMIFPNDSKYESSYDQPFFEMMSRFQYNLRKDNVLLICIGFSFYDKHIVTAIKEAVSQNPSFRLMIICRTIPDSETMGWFKEMAKKQFNVTIVSEDFKDFVQNYPTSKIYSDKLQQAVSEDAQQ